MRTESEMVVVRYTAVEPKASMTGRLNGSASAGGVAVDALDVTFGETAGDLSLRVTRPQQATPEGVPSVADGRPLRYFTVDADGSADYERVRFQFSVAATALPDRATPDDVVLYHYTDGAWVTVPTTYDPETDSYTATVESLSPFAVGTVESESVATSAVEVVTASLGETTIQSGESMTVTVELVNDGAAEATRTVTLATDGTTLTTRTVTLAANESRTVTFEPTFDAPGAYALSVDGTRVGEVSVAATATESSGSTTPTPTSTAQPSVWFGAGSALLLVLAALLLARRNEPKEGDD